MMTREWIRPAAVGLLVVLTAAAGGTAWGKPGTVTTLDGQTYEGEVTEKGETVVVRTKGNIPVTIKRENVDGIEYGGSTKEQFDQRMAKLGKQDAIGRVELAQWALDKQEYDLSLDALDAAIAIDPNNADARRLQRTVSTRRSMQRAQAANAKRTGARQAPGQAEQAAEQGPDQPADAAPADAADAEADSRPAAARQRGDAAAAADAGTQGGQSGADDLPEKLRMVTPAEINRIRQMELQKGEKVRVSFQNDVKQRYLASSDVKPQDFNKMPPPEQAREILNNGPEGLHRDVTIATDPATLAQFKQNVQRHVLLGCATAACHGGPDAGRFKLHTGTPIKDPETYTNFLLMQRFQAEVDGKQRSMIDRARPEDSLVLLMGLPPRDAAVPHPEAKNFRPLYKGKNDPKYQGVLAWMEEALGPVQPEYGIDLTKPAEADDAGGRPGRRPSGAGGRDMQDAPTGGRGGGGAAPPPRGGGGQQ